MKKTLLLFFAFGILQMACKKDDGNNNPPTGTDLPTYQDSRSFKSKLNDSDQIGRTYNYVEVLDDQPNKSGYTIRNQQYKLLQLDNGQQRFYELLNDPYEQTNLMMGTLSSTEETALQALVNELAK